MKISRLYPSDSGGALVELALVLPTLVLVFLGTIDFGRVFHTSESLTSAARAGAQHGAYSVARSADVAGMKAAAESSTGVSGITAVASRSCQCATDDGAFSATSPAPNDCDSPPETSCPARHRIITVTVSTSKTFNTLMAGGLPSFMQSLTLTRTATLRAE